MVWSSSLRQLLHVGARALDILCPPSCAACGSVGAEVCRSCRCSIVEELRTNHLSHSTDPNCTIVSEFGGRLRDVLSGMKFKNHRGAARYLGGLVARKLISDGVVPGVDVQAVTWVPTTARRRRDRGFDPSELMARIVGAQLGLPVVRMLDRVDSGEQKSRSRIERLNGPGFRGRRTRFDRVVLIDDVVTTGATMAAASGALRTAGISHIHSAAVAETPRRRAETLQSPREQYSTAA
jgi:predicted amidophosphoribosyltransferase